MTIELMLGDCFDLIKNVGDKSVDMILTDPPYDFDAETRKMLQKEFVRVCRDQRRLDIAEEFFVRAVRDLGIPEELITLVAKETNMDLGDDDGGTKLGESTPRT